MVEHLNIFPQAVPSSICITTCQSFVAPSKAQQASSQGGALQIRKSVAGLVVCVCGRLTLLPEKWWTAVLANME